MKQSYDKGLTPAPAVRELQAYAIPAPNPLIDLPLGGTERPVMAGELRASQHNIDAESLGRYPDARSLEAVLSARFGVAPDAVLVTAGADEALDRACRAMLCPGRELAASEPTFEMILHYARLAGGTVKTVPWPQGAFPVDAMLACVTPQTRILSVVTPNNPTGAVAAADDLRRLAAAAPHALVLVDMAYAEYADVDLAATILRLPNALMVRTLSKAWGLPGLRIGYAVGDPKVIGWLRAAGGPYTVSRPSLALAHARLGVGEPEMRGHVERVVNERRQLESLLRHLGATALPSQANFVLATFENATWVTQALASLGLGARAFPRLPGFAETRRIACPGDADAFARLSGALRAALTPQALLFDMDGVLADVSGSYRQAIIDTAAAFDVNITLADIAAVKAAGGANNDWGVTHRLLGTHGVHVSLDVVTEKFEALYQGTAAQPGLRNRESLLCSPSLLAELASKLPLAVVTGRPRNDAERFLHEQGIAAHFKVVVCMEDGPIKPDPTSVRLALERLGVQAAWMLGDTPDDLRASRSASVGDYGVVPLGIVPPGEDTERSHTVLMKAGAARILNHLSDLLELLP